MTLLFGLSLFPALIGLFVIYHIARPQKAPADTSNRFNKVRLLWFCLKNEHRLAETIGWVRKDEWEIVQPNLLDGDDQ